MTENDIQLPPIEERPLVTFALFAYNQEKYIREAVEGAFSQTYEPLEIILSDDCSSDKTYRIMNEMIASYDGPHTVKINKTQSNNGLISHIKDVVSIASGNLIVLAAGDDISLPERTQKHVEVYIEFPKTYAVCSNYFSMSEIPVVLEKQINKGLREFSLFRHLMNAGGWGAGATYSYRKECFSWPIDLPDHIEIEDKVLPIRAALLGKVAFINLRLVRYRTALESGNIVQKRRWQRKECLLPIFIHIDFIFSIMRSSGLIGCVRHFFYKNILLIAVYRLDLMHKDDCKALNIFLRALIYFLWVPLLIYMRIERFFDFYSPILR